MAYTSEADLENWMLRQLEIQGYTRGHGADISPEMKPAERQSFRDTVLEGDLRAAVAKLNPELSESAVIEATKRLVDIKFTSDLLQENRRIHDLLVNGLPLTYYADGDERNARVRYVDWANERNNWRVINQVDIAGKNPRIPDVIIFLNGLPLVVVELKGLEGADLEAAYNQIETYKLDIPDLFRTTLMSVISDGTRPVTARSLLGWTASCSGQRLMGLKGSCPAHRWP